MLVSLRRAPICNHKVTKMYVLFLKLKFISLEFQHIHIINTSCNARNVHFAITLTISNLLAYVTAGRHSIKMSSVERLGVYFQ